MASWYAGFLLPFYAVIPFCNSHCPSIKNKSSTKLQSSGKDEKKQGKTNQTKLGQANILSRLTFSWINSLLRLGYAKPLILEDIPTLLSDDEARSAYKTFSSKWEFLHRGDGKLNNPKNLLLKALFRVHWKEMIFVGVCALFRTFAVVVSPLLLYAIVQYTSNEHKNRSEGLLLVGWLVIVKFIESFSQRHWFFNSRRLGMRMRSALIMAIYRKQLKLSSLARRRHSTGEIVNYIAVDAYRMAEALYWFHLEWSLVVQLFLAIGVLFKVVGLSAFPGLVFVLITGFLNVPFARIYNKCQILYKVAQDERLRATSEVLNNMKIIKLQSWEEKFKNVIDLLRENEHKLLAKTQINKSSANVLYWVTPTIVSTVVFFGCLVMKSAPLNAATIFTILATLRCMSEPMRFIPEALSMLIEMKISSDHLNAFLLADELSDEESNKSSKSLKHSSDIRVEIRGNFSWESESAVPALRDINLEVKNGHKIAVCGQVGAGKSTLLCAILGEVYRISGSASVNGTIAYVSQAPWIQSEIGERGLNLSGGQKQRIQLARAVYNDADIYLLDDPFSAVDAETAAILFNDCVMDALQEKSIVLVTHQVEFLTKADKILVIEGGQITQSGTYVELLSTPGTTFAQLLNAQKKVVSELVTFDTGNMDETHKIHDNQSELSGESCCTREGGEKEISVEGSLNIQLTKEEEREIGDVGCKPMLDYLYVSKGSLLFILTILCYLAFSALQACASYWLATATRFYKVNNAMLVGVYAGISTISIPFVYSRNLYATFLGLKASKAFFFGINNSIFKAPMLFFDSTPVGRIFARMSSDMNTLDIDLSATINVSVAATIDALMIVAIMASVTWPVLIVAIPTIIIAKYVQGYYLSSAREFMRMNGTTIAPILNYVSETSQGVVSIRAFNMMEMFFENYLKLIDTDARLFFHSNAAIEWLVLRIETLQNLVILTAALLIVLLPRKQLPGFVGLSLSYALTLSTVQVVMTRVHCNLSNQIVSVERIKQFMHIPPEPPTIIEDMRPPASWPLQGRIELENLKIRYRPNAPLALEKCQLKAIVSSLPKLLDSSVSDEDSDMVMVLSYGELVEYDVPSKLMETNSAFSKLVAEYSSNYKRNSTQS
ncbi:hypothetical protein Q3G72_006373 [Acer saccharum]|nr:hypothetical protein Q3G72_006373 [Acer saccharum]